MRDSSAESFIKHRFVHLYVFAENERFKGVKGVKGVMGGNWNVSE